MKAVTIYTLACNIGTAMTQDELTATITSLEAGEPFEVPGPDGVVWWVNPSMVCVVSVSPED